MSEELEYDDNGLLIAASLEDGFGIPVVDHYRVSDYKVSLDGEEIGHVVAFDRAGGLVWCVAGYNEGKFKFEKLSGKVEVRRSAVGSEVA